MLRVFFSDSFKLIFRLAERSVQKDKITRFVSNFYLKINTFLRELNTWCLKQMSF